MMPPEGWYADPGAPGQMRWWDGATWTAHVAPAPVLGHPGAEAWGIASAPSTSPARAARPGRTPLVFGLLGGGAVLVILLVVGLIAFDHSRSPAGSSGSSAPSPSIDPGQNVVAQRAAAAGVPLLGFQGAVTHTHTLLHVRVDGVAQVIPAGIGIHVASKTLAAVHTHASTGVVHVESPVPDAHYRLRQFLVLWGVGSTEQTLCQHFVGGPCQVHVAVVAPTSQDALTFTGFGPMPNQPPTVARGLDTDLDQGAVIELDLTSTSKQ